MKTNTIPEAPQKIELSKNVAEFVSQPVIIKSIESNEIVADQLAQIKGEINRLDADRKTFTKPLDDLKKAIMERYEQAIKPLKQFEINAKNALSQWDYIERARIAKENERLRLEGEEKARKEQEKLSKQAEKAAAKGNEEKAEELRQKSEMVQSAPAPVVQQQKASGISFKTKWRCEVIDPDLIPRSYCMPDQKRLDNVVNAMAGKIEIQGVRIIEEKIVASASR